MPDVREPPDPRLVAGMQLLGRTGAAEVQIRYSDDEQPVVWFAVGTWRRNGREKHEAAAALDPVRAVLRLCEQVIDGGACAWCKRPAGFIADDPADVADSPVDRLVCWYQWDPELSTFRRSCEGDTES